MSGSLDHDALRAEAERASWILRRDDGPLRPVRRTAGLWAIGVLKKNLGDDWPARTRAREGSVPPELADSSFHAVAFVELLRLAAALCELEAVPGFARLRSGLATDLREEVRTHIRVQLELGALCAVVGGEATFEQRATGTAPVDVCLRVGNNVLPVEVRVVTKDKQMRAGDELANRFQRHLMRITFEHDVNLDGDLRALPEDAVDELLVAIEKAAKAAHDHQAPERVDHPLASMEALPAQLAASGTTYGFPVGSGRGLPRTAEILRSKVEQIRRSGSTWLRVELLDGTWMFSQLAQMKFATRARGLALFAYKTLGPDSGLHGIAISSGPAMTMSSVVGESVLTGPVRALRRDLGTFTGRETVVVPLADEGLEEAKVFVAMHDAEAQWLDGALARAGLAPMTVLNRPHAQED